MSRPQSTSELRTRSGLNRAARSALIRALDDAGAHHGSIITRFLRSEAYADLADYRDAVAASWGEQVAEDMIGEIENLVEQRADHYALDSEGERNRAFGQYASLGLLLAMPEGDFLTALEIGATLATDVNEVAAMPQYLNRICQQRGIPYTVEGTGGEIVFSWHGDGVVNEEAVEPALGVLDDPRLAAGARKEFAQARKELRAGMAETLKQSVAESCNAVESTMKVLIEAHGLALPERQNAQDLFNALVASGLVAKEAEEIALGAARFGNRRGRHGGGAVAHAVSDAEAQAVLAAAATAIALLAARLP